MGLLVACKNEDDPIKNEGAGSTHCSSITEILTLFDA